MRICDNDVDGGKAVSNSVSRRGISLHVGEFTVEDPHALITLR